MCKSRRTQVVRLHLQAVRAGFSSCLFQTNPYNNWWNSADFTTIDGVEICQVIGSTVEASNTPPGSEAEPAGTIEV